MRATKSLYLCTGQIEASTSPPGIPGHLTVHCAREGGNLNVALEEWGI